MACGLLVIFADHKQHSLLTPISWCSSPNLSSAPYLPHVGTQEKEVEFILSIDIPVAEKNERWWHQAKPLKRCSHYNGQSLSCGQACFQLNQKYTKCPIGTGLAGRDGMKIFLQDCDIFQQVCLFVKQITFGCDQKRHKEWAWYISYCLTVPPNVIEMVGTQVFISKSKLFAILQFKCSSKCIYLVDKGQN